MYRLTEEDRKLTKAHNQKWIDLAFRTTPQTEEDREICRNAAVKMYEHSAIKSLDKKKVVFVPSPFMACFVAGAASWIVYQNKHTASRHIRFETNDATSVAT